MNPGLRITRTQLLLFVLLIVSLLVAAFFIIHTAAPGMLHGIADGPDVPYWHP
ncbi:MAG TPA: hypothetical protein VKR83_14645 [Ktedonobacteraceae bacterium]|nr:hypothetical protein [Ktedonobacteraceae bacterium]